MLCIKWSSLSILEFWDLELWALTEKPEVKH